ncbi:hypothetical protein [Streptosporangium lutulentum]|uniref:Tetratricopeptide (TPR) repeat protein n=1 Tax=Streptosporangium lutulentum TaxID=1461250 RepID=A0ABT9Q777_9ACTN|nr:hypothetical protein [Streptosporangium lutulentum]MDP9842226.1 tetratricopeptide (TPR) repeat protein [Streptosporangium lutulentum]
MKNTALQEAIAAAGKPYTQIAKTINAVGAEAGQSMYYDPAAIAHWLSGTIPASTAVPVIVEAFARLLGWDLAAHDLGWPHNEAAPEDPWEGDPVAWVTRLGRDDMLNRRSLLSAGLYSLAALNLPANLRTITARSGQPRRAGASDVERIRMMSSQFATADDMFGGGHARSTVLAYLIHEVTPLLHGTTGKARPELFTAASQMTYLAAFMASDAGNAAGLAQKYYIQAVRLAEEAGDPTAKATALRGLATQAVELGHSARAVALAEEAVSTLRGKCPVRVRAWMAGMCADAHAANGNTKAALNALHQAESDVERADSIPESQWTGAYRRASLEHQTGTTLAQLADLSAAEAHLINSVHARRNIERRSRVLIAARLAGVQLRQRRPDVAAATVLELRDDLPLLASGRVTGELVKLRASWVPDRGNPTVNEADRLIASLTDR